MISHTTTVLNLVGGLAIFLLGLEILSNALKAISLPAMQNFLLRSSNTPAKGILTGTIATTLLDSSSVTIILLIAFVDSNLIKFANASGIVLGANIGTTISSQIIALKIGDYAAIGLIVSVIGNIITKSERIKQYCNMLMGFSLLFYGLHLMDMSVYAYRDSTEVIALLKNLQNPFYGVLAGAVVTLIIQSSSATVGIVIVMASQGLLTLDAGIAAMLGAEIGTCSDTLIASIGRNREAIKVGIFHLLFNIIAVIAGLVLFDVLHDVTLFMSYKADIGQQIANAHLLFNLSSVFIAYIFLTIYNRRLN